MLVREKAELDKVGQRFLCKYYKLVK